MEKEEKREIRQLIKAAGNREFCNVHGIAERDRLWAAFWNLLVGLQVGGCSVDSFELVEIEGQSDRYVEVTFESGLKKRACITWDSIPQAIFDVMNQVPELRERG